MMRSVAILCKTSSWAGYLLPAGASVQLSIPIRTVKRHNTRIFAKLGVTTRTDTVRRGWTLGEFAEGRS